MQDTAPVAPAENAKRHPFKGMARTDDFYLLGIAIQMMAVVGSLSSDSSTTLTTDC
jgi:hypothetical protein